MVRFETHPSRWFYFAEIVPFVLVVLAFLYVVGTHFISALPAVPYATHALAPPSGIATSSWDLVLGLASFVLFWAMVIAWAVRARKWSEFSYAVTDTRIIQQRRAKGLGLDIQEIPLRQIRDVELIRGSRHGFGIGTLRVRSLSYMSVGSDEIVNGVLVERHLDAQGHENRPPTYTDVIDPRTDFALHRSGAGVEWWIGVPKAMEIERIIAGATRGVFHDDTPTPVTPTPAD